jgi:hypothetical protein
MPQLVGGALPFIARFYDFRLTGRGSFHVKAFFAIVLL